MEILRWLALIWIAMAYFISWFAVRAYCAIQEISISPLNILLLAIMVSTITFMFEFFFSSVTRAIKELDVCNLNKKWPAWLANAGSPDKKKVEQTFYSGGGSNGATNSN
jgi:hypothetical protein